MKNLYLILAGILATSCATVNSVVEGGKDIAMTTVDKTVKTAGNISSAALQDVSSLVTTVAETYEGVNNGCFNTPRNYNNNNIVFY